LVPPYSGGIGRAPIDDGRPAAEGVTMFKSLAVITVVLIGIGLYRSRRGRTAA